MRRNIIFKNLIKNEYHNNKEISTTANYSKNGYATDVIIVVF